MLPYRYAIDYNAALSAATQSAVNIAPALQNGLPVIWREAYLRTITHEPNLVRFRHVRIHLRPYSQLELTGSVPYDQTIADRVIGVFPQKCRNGCRTKIELSEELEGTQRDQLTGGCDAESI